MSISLKAPAASGSSGCAPRIRSRILGESVLAQFTRFVIVGVSSNGVYALLFLALASLGSFTANLAGVAASTVLANELHRRHTFHATGRVGWFQTQWEAGGLALVGLGLSTASLAAMHILFPVAPTYVQVLVVIAVSGIFGAARFLALRGWVFRSPTLSTPVSNLATR
ncbi:GtrA family protein [Rhodococcoides fascians]|uniref:GtrA family protein n=1 Tax=Rhodococcoides fascians TaxID=1828 RepID=UPI00117AAC4A|nr:MULTISPECIES: GtrA family protein [Rhodococcus]